MPIDNPYYIKENLAQIQEVREIEEKELMMPEQQAKITNYFQERQELITKKSKLSPVARSKIIQRHGANYLSERAFNNDIALMQMYGPGIWEDIGGFVIKTAATTVAAGAIVATGGAAAPLIGAGMWAGGKVAEEIGKETDCQLLRSVGSLTKDTGFGAVTGGLFTGEGAVTTAVKNGWSLEKVEKIGKALEIKGYVDGSREVIEHNAHRRRGISYDRDCPVCNL